MGLHCVDTADTIAARTATDSTTMSAMDDLRADWKPRMLPPYWLVLGIAAAIILGRWFPVAHVLKGDLRLLGMLPIVAGLLLALWGERQFSRAGTGLVPGSEVTVLVRSGPFRFTRNPMYLGMTFALFGASVLTGALSALAVLPVFIVVMQLRFIRNEEAMLRKKFGEHAWSEYAASTRRWLT